LKERSLSVEPFNVRLARAARKRRWKPRYAMRKPEGYRIDAPGDLLTRLVIFKEFIKINNKLR